MFWRRIERKMSSQIFLPGTSRCGWKTTVVGNMHIFCKILEDNYVSSCEKDCYKIWKFQLKTIQNMHKYHKIPNLQCSTWGKFEKRQCSLSINNIEAINGAVFILLTLAFLKRTFSSLKQLSEKSDFGPCFIGIQQYFSNSNQNTVILSLILPEQNEFHAVFMHSFERAHTLWKI